MGQQKCLITAIENSPCDPNDTKCVCTSESIRIQSGTCIGHSCTVKEALCMAQPGSTPSSDRPSCLTKSTVTKNATSTACGAPVRDRTPIFNTVTIVLGTITGIIVLLRLTSKFIMKIQYGWDDFFIAAVFVCGLPSTAMNVVGTGGHGEGKDIWTLSFDSITLFGYFFYVLEIMYFAQVSLLKMSLLFFYLKIFPGRARTLLWGTVIFNGLYGVTFMFLAAFQCSPVSYFWLGWDGEHQGSWYVP